MSHQDVQRGFLKKLSDGQSSPVDIIDSILEDHHDDPDIYTTLVSTLIGISLDAEDARVLLHRMLMHHQALLDTLGREMDFRLAAMDYALNHPELVPAPVVVDFNMLELTQRLAAVDELTGLFNRRFLEIYLQKELNRARRYDQIFSVVFVDLDDFKHVNDTHGHDVGDDVLRFLGSATQDLLRREDFAARYGGEEFVILLPQTDSAGAARFADRLRERIAGHLIRGLVRVSLSAGVASYPEHSEATPELLRKADEALYQAKVHGKNRVVVYSPEKRMAPRLATDIEAVCYRDESRIGTVKVRDISRKGVSLDSDTLLAPGQVFRLRIPLSEDGNRYGDHELEVHAQVVWSRKLGDVEYRFGGRWESEDESLVTSLMRQASGL